MSSSEKSLNQNFDFKNFSKKMDSKYKAVDSSSANDSQPGMITTFSPFGEADFGQPTDTDYRLIKALIRSMPEITAPVMRMADYTIGSSQGRPYYISSENDSHKQQTEDLFTAMKLAFILKTSAIQAYAFGDCYWNLIHALDAFAVISAETMRIVTDKFGTVEAYIQRLLRNPTDKLVFFPSDIEHIRLNDLGSELYGFSQIESLMTTVTRLLQMENFDGDFFRNNGIPRGAWFLEGMTEPEYEKWKANMKALKEKGWQRDLVFHMENENGSIKYQRISETNQEMNFQDGFKHQQNRVVIGSGVPKLVQGDPEGSNKATGFVQHESFARPVRAMQLMFEDSINSRIIPKFLGFNDTKIIIPPPEFHSPGEKIRNQYFIVQGLSKGFNDLQITDKARIDAIQRKFMDVMEIDMQKISSSKKTPPLYGANGKSSHALHEQAEDHKSILGLENKIDKLTKLLESKENKGEK